MLTSTWQCQTLSPECTIPSRYDVHCIPSPLHVFCVILYEFAKNKHLGSENVSTVYSDCLNRS